MSQLAIRIFGDPVLRQKAQEVTSFDARLRRLADDMMETMLAAPGVGLAAPQVGVLKRLFTWQVDRGPDFAAEFGEDARVLGGGIVNPVLIDADDENLLNDDEGCLSFPGLFYPVERPQRVEIRWQDLHGEEHVSQYEGFEARVWLHEMDHLDGIMFIDHLARHDKQEAMKLMRAYRAEHGIDADEPPRGGFLLGRR